MKAFLFPGQGCQKQGMGKDLYEQFPKAKAIFEQANDILGERFSDTLFTASEDLLMDTRYTQLGQVIRCDMFIYFQIFQRGRRPSSYNEIVFGSSFRRSSILLYDDLLPAFIA